MRIAIVGALILAAASLQSYAADVKTGFDPLQTLQRINANYNSIVHRCEEPDTHASRGHYYCSGVTLRMVNDGGFNPWDYSPYAIKTGATSFSWIRADLSIKTLIHPAGFVMRTPIDALSLGLPAKQEGWTCIYAFDGYTGPERKWYGCGPFNDANFVPPPQPAINKNAEWAYGTCADQKVDTAEQWKQKYPGGSQRPIQTSQCSWSAEAPAQWDAMIKTHEARLTTPTTDPFSRKDLFNEFMLKNTSATNDGSESMKFIDAFIYQAKTNYNYPTRGDAAPPKAEDGLTSARDFQRKLYAQGFAVPILNIDFARPAQQRFAYYAGDQVIPLNGVQPSRYIASSSWVERFDPGTKNNEWTLTLNLTPAGQKLGAKDSQALYDEIYGLRGNDHNWVDNEHISGSMRQQVICLKTNYPAKTQLNIEPFRPLVSATQAKADGCNPVAVR